MSLIKALSVRQPWAELIASGEKTIEVRTWKTSYRGELLICAAAAMDKRWAKQNLGLPTGVAVAIVELVACRPYLDGSDDAAARCEPGEGYFAWVLTNVRRVKTPFAVKGKLNLFQVELPAGAILLPALLPALAVPQTAPAASSS